MTDDDDYYRRHDHDGTPEIVAWCFVLMIVLLCAVVIA